MPDAPRLQSRFIWQEAPLGALTLSECNGFLTGITWDARELTHPADTPLLREAIRQLAAYFKGELKRFELPLAPTGTPFQQQVWRALQEIPYGETATYSDIARRIGRPQAVRAVGMANHRNPIAIVVPCHRVIGKNGHLTGYAGGLAVKSRLLQTEAAFSGKQICFPD